jgi:hypothetical protein
VKRALKLWLSFLVLLTSWCILPQMTHAQKVPTHGNVSPHIYQDRDFFSQDQIDSLEKQNDELADSKQHQITKIFILSPKKMGADFKFPAKYMDINDFNDPENPAGISKKQLSIKKALTALAIIRD